MRGGFDGRPRTGSAAVVNASGGNVATAAVVLEHQHEKFRRLERCLVFATSLVGGLMLKLTKKSTDEFFIRSNLHSLTCANM